MENPASWKPAELVVLDAYNDWMTANSLGAIGASLPSAVCEALRRDGYLVDDHQEEIGWDGLRRHHAIRRQERSERGPSSPAPDNN